MKKNNFIIRYIQEFKEKIEDYNFNNSNDYWIKKIFFKIVKTLYITFFRFRNDNCVLHASALTYTSLLALVPILALMFSLLKGLGVKSDFLKILVNIISANQKLIAENIMHYLENTSATKLGTIGAVSLLITAILVLATIEKSFNVIWGVKNTRATVRKITDYLSALIVGPTFLVGAISATALIKVPTYLENIQIINVAYALLIKYLPYIFMWIVFTFFYIFMPNTKVKLVPALIGGLIGSMLWQSAQMLYIGLNEYMVNFKIIYGSLAALPLFFIWLYTSWVIVLFGAEVSFAIQNVTNYRSSIENIRLTPFELMQISIIIMYYVSKSFYLKGKKKYITIQYLTNKLNLSDRIINYIVSNLTEAGLLSVDNTDPERIIVPRIDPEHITIKKVADAIINNTTKKSIILTMKEQLDQNIYEKIEIFNNKDFLLNSNFKEIVFSEK
ncbi:MAG TPA: YihY/virulence factor BrkB family protein [bacterium]|nr:YihY/virulence factor BrkB family protein [bacterium]